MNLFFCWPFSLFLSSWDSVVCVEFREDVNLTNEQLLSRLEQKRFTYTCKHTHTHALKHTHSHTLTRTHALTHKHTSKRLWFHLPMSCSRGKVIVCHKATETFTRVKEVWPGVYIVCVIAPVTRLLSIISRCLHVCVCVWVCVRMHVHVWNSPSETL